MDPPLPEGYTAEPGPHMGRFDKPKRKGFYLTSRQGRRFFLKVVTLTDRAAFDREVEANRVFTAGTPAAFVKSWVEGDFGYLMNKYMPAVYWSSLTARAQKRAVRDVVQQLRRIHDLGFEHGDLAPKNILIDRDGRAVIIDYEDVAPATRSGKQMDWQEIRLAFVPRAKPNDDKWPRQVRLFNSFQREMAAGGRVLILSTEPEDHTVTSWTYCLMDGRRELSRAIVTKSRSRRFVKHRKITLDPDEHTCELVGMLKQVVMYGTYMRVPRTYDFRCLVEIGFMEAGRTRNTVTLTG